MAKCGKPCEVWTRVVGYITPTFKWNKGRREEFKHRKTFVVPEIAQLSESTEKGQSDK